jgi:hypothetical protein
VEAVITKIGLDEMVALDLGSSEPIVVRVEYTKRVTVESWPRETSFDCYLLKTADPEMMTVDGDEVTITVANGQAVYRLGPEELTAPVRPAYLVSSRLSEA